VSSASKNFNLVASAVIDAASFAQKGAQTVGKKSQSFVSI